MVRIIGSVSSSFSGFARRGSLRLFPRGLLRRGPGGALSLLKRPFLELTAAFDGLLWLWCVIISWTGAASGSFRGLSVGLRGSRMALWVTEPVLEALWQL